MAIAKNVSRKRSMTKDLISRELGSNGIMPAKFLTSEASIAHLQEIQQYNCEELIFMGFNPRGDMLAVCPAAEKTIIFLKWMTNEETIKLNTGHFHGSIQKFEWMPHAEHSMLIVNDSDGTLQLFDLNTTMVMNLLQYQDWINAAACGEHRHLSEIFPFRVHPDFPNNVLVADRYAQSMFNVDIRVGRPMPMLSKFPVLKYSALALNPCNPFEFSTIGKLSTVLIFDLRKLSLPTQVIKYSGLEYQEKAISILESSSDGKELILVCNTPTNTDKICLIQKENPTNHKYIQPEPYVPIVITSPHFYGPNSEFFIFGSASLTTNHFNQINIYNCETGELIRWLNAEEVFVACNSRFPNFAFGEELIRIWGFDRVCLP